MIEKRNRPGEDRYSRQVRFAGIGNEGQLKLSESRVLIIGCGGLGSVISELLVRAGVGYIRIIDRDVLELNNLQRQILFDEQDVKDGLPKAIAAKRTLQKINSDIYIDAFVDDVNRFNIEDLMHDIDLVMDATDNYDTRFLINDTCIKNHVPWIFGACAAAYGLTMNIIPGKTLCLRCIFDKMPDFDSAPTSETAGIINPIVTTIAAVQASEALKILTANLDSVNKKLLTIDLWNNDFDQIKIDHVKQEQKCPVCDYRQFTFLSGKYSTSYTSICGIDTVQILPFGKMELDLSGVAITLSEYGDPILTDYYVKLEVDGYECTIFPDGRAVIKGTTDTGIARGLYNKFLTI